MTLQVRCHFKKEIIITSRGHNNLVDEKAQFSWDELLLVRMSRSSHSFLKSAPFAVNGAV
jgi:hypothetical protein